MDALYTQSFQHFVHIFHGQPVHSIFAPGRANIIGEHTDYNDGFVLPFATGLGIWFHAKPNNSGVLSIYAGNTNERIFLDPHLPNSPVFGWGKFFLQALGQLPFHSVTGADILFEGNLPIGAGMSSSSAITCGFVSLLNNVFCLGMNADDILWASVKAERGYGVLGGIMDQYTILNARYGDAILLDCRHNRSLYIPLHLDGCRFYMIHSNVHHNLIDTDYNNRRSACEKAVSLLEPSYPGIRSLRDFSASDLPFIKMLLHDDLYRKVMFVVEENARVAQAVSYLSEGDMPSLGSLLYASHQGLSEFYEVSCTELDWLIEYTKNQPDIFGARMMGGGFGGCTINLVKGTLTDEFQHNLKENYNKEFGIIPDIFEVSSANGILQPN